MRPLRIAMVAHGFMPIPPPGWGAVENVIWQLATRVRAMGHHVEIVNVKKRRVPWQVLRLGALDFVHVHNDRAVSRVLAFARLRRFRTIATSHWSYPATQKELEPPQRESLMRVARAPYHLPISTFGAELINQFNPEAQIVLQPNGAEVSEFRWSLSGNGRAICVGRIEERKRQGEVARVLLDAGIPIDFVGPVQDDLLPPGSSYLGQWTRAELRERLSDYSCLVLWSAAEGHPLVVPEALAAGLSVVVSPAAAAHLDPSWPFAEVASSSADLASTVERMIGTNDVHRQAARLTAVQRFDWDRIAESYVATLSAWAQERP